MPRNDARGGHTRGPSIRDVARLAEVSAQTVSRVSTGSDAVRPETRDRVLRAMEQARILAEPRGSRAARRQIRKHRPSGSSL
nr:LacI family DNA-binding transcriptional regulator [Demequina litorisediminis]